MVTVPWQGIFALADLIDSALWRLGIIDRPCGHKWRPARTSRGPARYCDICEETQDMDVAQFYAHFGRMPFHQP